MSSRPHVETRMVGEQKPVSHLTSKLQSFLLYRKAVFRFRRLRENLIRGRKQDGNLLLDFGLESYSVEILADIFDVIYFLWFQETLSHKP